METNSSDGPEVPPMTAVPAELRTPAARLKQQFATGSRTSNLCSGAKKTLAVSDVYPWLLEWLQQIQERHASIQLPVKAMSLGFVTVDQLKAVIRQLPMEELLQFNKVADADLQQLAGTSVLKHDEATNVIVDHYLHSMQRPHRTARTTHHNEEDMPQLHTRRAPWEMQESTSKQEADTFAAFTFVLEEHDRRVAATTKIQKRWRAWHAQCELHGRPLQGLRRDTRRLTYELRIAYDSLNIVNTEGGRLPKSWSPDDVEAKYRLLQMAEAIMMRLLDKQRRLQEGVSEVVALREMHAELRQLIASIGISVDEYQKQLKSRRNTQHGGSSTPGSPQRQSCSGGTQDQLRGAGLCRSRSRFADQTDGDAADEQPEASSGPLQLDGLSPKEKASRVAAGMRDYLGAQMQRQDSNAGRESNAGEETALACSVQAEADQLLRDLILNKAHDHMQLLDAVSSSKDIHHLREEVQMQVDHIKLQQQAGTWTPCKAPSTPSLPPLSPRPPARGDISSPSHHPTPYGSDARQQSEGHTEQLISSSTFPLQLPESRSSMLQRLIAMPPRSSVTTCSEPLLGDQNGINSNNHNRPVPSYMQPVRMSTEGSRDRKIVDIFKPPPNSVSLMPTVYDAAGIEEAKQRNVSQRVTISGSGSFITDKLYQPVQRISTTGRVDASPQQLMNQPSKRVTFSGKYNELPGHLVTHSNRASLNGAISSGSSSNGQSYAHDRSPNVLLQQLQGRSGSGQMSNNLTRLGSSNLAGSALKSTGNSGDFNLPKVRGASAGGAQEEGQTAFGHMIHALRQSHTSLAGHDALPETQRAASLGSLPAI